MRRIVAVAGICALLALAPACNRAPGQGEVAQRRHVAADSDWVSAKTTCTGSGSAKKCTTKPGYWDDDPAVWQLKLRAESGEGWLDVGEQAFNQCQVGERYPECAEA